MRTFKRVSSKFCDFSICKETHNTEPPNKYFKDHPIGENKLLGQTLFKSQRTDQKKLSSIPPISHTVILFQKHDKAPANLNLSHKLLVVYPLLRLPNLAA